MTKGNRYKSQKSQLAKQVRWKARRGWIKIRPFTAIDLVWAGSDLPSTNCSQVFYFEPHPRL